ncbi:MAG: hypothetical protein WAX85_00525 [Minisyncoccia bacterium]
MIKHKSTFFLGLFIFLVPFTGFPTFWKTTFIVLSGLALIGLSTKVVLPKKHPKPKVKKEKTTPILVDSSPVYPKDDTMESGGMR